jgi:hypothetical protein
MTPASSAAKLRLRIAWGEAYGERGTGGKREDWGKEGRLGERGTGRMRKENEDRGGIAGGKCFQAWGERGFVRENKRADVFDERRLLRQEATSEML